MAEKYSVSNKSVEQILNEIKSKEIVIPEIQRPFVWKPKQVRDLIDSLYTGYPTGYLIITQSPNMKLKNGQISQGEKIMIDGQQRTTALMTAILGFEAINTKFEKKAIKIAFNPLTEEVDEIFKVQDNAILKDKKWIADISKLFTSNFDSYTFIQEYCASNPDIITPTELNKKITQLLSIKNRSIGVITLDKDLTIDEVTEIFIRINLQGAKLNQSDFAMSKIAANTKYSGNMLRKAIDYFSHLAVAPDWYSGMAKDTEFCNTDYFQKLKWIKDDIEDIYNPDYGDILRVAFMSQFGRAKMKDLVSLLGGRDFETRDYKEEIAEKSFEKLTKSTLDFMNEFNFKDFVLAIKSAGFISSWLINSKMTIDFAYTLYLLLKQNASIERTKIKQYGAKWYVLSTLTSRYTGSPETAMDADMRRIKEKGFLEFLKETEEAELSNNFWETGLVQNLEISVINSPYFNVFVASQIHLGANSLFLNGTKIADLLTLVGDIHHIFPKQYLIDNNIADKSQYNQIANYAFLDKAINISIGKKSPKEYFEIVEKQTTTKELKLGNIADGDLLCKNFEENCIPKEIANMTFADYDRFLLLRRKLMAKKIKEYYYSL
jgi:hypothetical protein